MSFPAYEEYKDSGVEWLGEVPEAWSCTAMTRIAERVVVGIAEAATHAPTTGFQFSVQRTFELDGFVARFSMLIRHSLTSVNPSESTRAIS